eukprot:PhM_4_TR9792/c0_g1_i1/m.53192
MDSSTMNNASFTKLDFIQQHISLIIHISVGFIIPIILLASALTANADTFLSDVTVMCWAFLIHASITSITFHRKEDENEENKENRRLRRIRHGVPFVLASICTLVFVLVVLLAEDPAIPNSPALVDLADTGKCDLYDPVSDWSDISCRKVEYFQVLHPSVEADMLANGSKISGPASFTPMQVRTLSIGRAVEHLISLIPQILFITIPETMEDTSVETYQVKCSQMMEKYACAAMFRPCSGTCRTAALPCQSTCQAVLDACPGIYKMYDKNAPGTDLRSVVFAAEDELGPLYRAVDRIFYSLKHRCKVGDSSVVELGLNLTTPDVDDTCINNLDYIPSDLGKCNPTTRAELQQENRKRLTLYQAELDDRDDTIAHLTSIRRALPFGFFTVFALLLHALTIKRLSGARKEQLEDANEFWRRWWAVTPRVALFAIPVQVTVLVLLLLMARYVEDTTDYWPVAAIENLISLVLLSYTFETAVCFVRLDDESDLTNTRQLRRRRRKTILYEVSVYGRYFAFKVCAQELLEVAVQFTYFFAAIHTNDQATIVVQATVLFINMMFTPYLMMTHRSSVVLFDAIVEAIYLIINIISALTRNEDTQSMSVFSTLVEMVSLCFSSWGCVTSLYILSQYYFHYTRTGFVVESTDEAMTTATGEMRIIVRGVGGDQDNVGDTQNTANVVPIVDMGMAEPNTRERERREHGPWFAVTSPSSPTPFLPPREDGDETTTPDDDDDESEQEREKEKEPPQPQAQKEQKEAVDDRQTMYKRALVPVSRNTRYAVTTIFVALSLTFYVSTLTRVGMQSQSCRDLVGSTLWGHVNPKLLFPDGFGAATRCDFKVATTVDISHEGLVHVPEGLRYFTSLRSLDLSNNAIMEIPEFIADLPLEHLDFSQNKIWRVHPRVFETPPLQSITVYGNAFATYIDWGHDNLTAIPRHLTLLNATETLLMNNNRLTDIDNVFNNFDVTEKLDLSYNNIAHLPLSVIASVESKLVNLSHNQLVAQGTLSNAPMSQGIATLVTNEIDVSYNHLEAIPTIFIYATTATFDRKTIIHIQHNQITNVSLRNLGAISSTINVPFFSDIKNDITSFDASTQWIVQGAPIPLFGSTSLKLLNFSDIGWGHDPRIERCRAFRLEEWWRLVNSFSVLETLDVSFDHMFRHYCAIPPIGTPLNVPSLRSLWSRGGNTQGLLHCERCFNDSMTNKLVEIDASGYNHSAHLKYTNVSTNVVFPQILRFAASLQKLYLDKTGIEGTAFGNVISQLSQLRYLSLEYSDVVSLAANVVDFSPLIHLQVLSLRGSSNLNNISFLTSSFLGSLSTFDASGCNLEGTVDLSPLLRTSRPIKCVFIGGQRTTARLIPQPAPSSWSPTLRVVDLTGVQSSGLFTTSHSSLLQVVCVHPDDLQHCVAALGDTICNEGSAQCERYREKENVCDLNPHVYTPLQVHSAASTTVACNNCESTCARDFIGPDASMDNFEDALPIRQDC